MKDCQKRRWDKEFERIDTHRVVVLEVEIESLLGIRQIQGPKEDVGVSIATIQSGLPPGVGGKVGCDEGQGAGPRGIARETRREGVNDKLREKILPKGQGNDRDTSEKRLHSTWRLKKRAA